MPVIRRRAIGMRDRRLRFGYVVKERGNGGLGVAVSSGTAIERAFADGDGQLRMRQTSPSE